MAREEVNDRPGGGRRQVEGNTASHAGSTPPSEGEVVGTTVAACWRVMYQSATHVNSRQNLSYFE